MNRVFIVSPFENSLTGRGLRYPNLLQLLSSRDDLRGVLLTSDFDHGRKSHFEDQSFSKQEVSFHVLGYTNHFGIKRFITHWQFAFKVFFYLFRFARRNDRVVISTIPPEVFALVTIVSRMKGAQVVSDVRDVWPDAFPFSGFKKSLFSAYCHIFNKIGLVLSTRLVVVSQSFQTWLQRYLPEIRKADFVPLGFNVQRWRSASDADGEAQQEQFKYVYVGGLTPQFDLTEFEFLRRNRGRGMAVIGSGPLEPVYREAFPEATFFGVLDQIESAKIILLSRFGLIPGSQFASLPNKTFDFLAAGKPAICRKDTEVFNFLNEWDLAIAAENFTELAKSEACSQRLGCVSDTHDERMHYEHGRLSEKLLNIVEAKSP